MNDAGGTPSLSAEAVRPSAAPLQNRFHVAAVAFLRAKQLQAGAKPRVPWNGHKPPKLAVCEVLADAVSWSVEEKARIVERGLAG